MAGKTFAVNKAKNPTPIFTPTINKAIDKNNDPLIRVPTAVKIGAPMEGFTRSLISKTNPKKMNAVIGFSIMFGICPKGNVVVNAETNPVATANTSTYFNRGNKTIPKNIIASDISGLIPNKIGGNTACKAAPIPTNNAKITNTLVFICILSSTILNSIPQTYSTRRLRKCVYIIANFQVNTKV